MMYDVLVIGCGPGGYRAAVESARLGAKVCAIEKDELGGICVNKGCIPTKTILNNALLHIDYPKIQNRVKGVVMCMKKQMEQVINASKIDVIHGTAELLSNNMVRVGDREINAKKIIIATGSRPKGLVDFPFDNKRIFSAEGFLEVTELPRSVLIAGAGYIGCEWAGILACLGVKVQLVEMKEKILPYEDSDLTRVVESSLKKMGVDIRVGAMVNEITQDKAIVSVGREPVIDGIREVETTDGGWIKVDEYMQTNLANVYAIGDVVGPPLLAYTAEREGMAVAHNISMDYRFIPRVVFSIPELASVGKREHEVSGAEVVRAYYKGLGRACSDGESNGLVKIIYDKSNYKVLGVGIAGRNACELISEATLVLNCGLTVSEWAGMVHPHPVYSEIFGEALEKV